MSELIVKFHHDERGIARSWEETGKIIRCKDCKRYGQDNCFMKIQMLWELNPDDFCSQAERRGEQE